MIPKNVIACQIQYRGIKIRCDDYRNREANLGGAWKLMIVELQSRGWKIPDSRKSFESSGGKVSYYKSF